MYTTQTSSGSQVAACPAVAVLHLTAQLQQPLPFLLEYTALAQMLYTGCFPICCQGQ